MEVPTVMHVSNTTVTLKYKPPYGAEEFRQLRYLVQFRKEEGYMWLGLWELRCQMETAYGLDPDTVYLFGVAAKYTGGSYGPVSEIIYVKTEPTVTGKCDCLFVFKAPRYRVFTVSVWHIM